MRVPRSLACSVLPGGSARTGSGILSIYDSLAFSLHCSKVLRREKLHVLIFSFMHPILTRLYRRSAGRCPHRVVGAGCITTVHNRITKFSSLKLRSLFAEKRTAKVFSIRRVVLRNTYFFRSFYVQFGSQSLCAYSKKRIPNTVPYEFLRLQRCMCCLRSFLLENVLLKLSPYYKSCFFCCTHVTAVY